MEENQQPSPQPEDKAPEAPNSGRPWLMIRLDENNAMHVNGIINDKILSYGLLESARDAIKAHHDRLNQATIVKPTNGFFNGIRGMKK